MCIWFLKGDDWDESQHPMNMISKTIANYLNENGSDEQGLRDHLADEKEAGRLNGCGCGKEATWGLEVTTTGYEVVIEPYSGQVFKVTVTEDDYSYERQSRAQAVKGYMDMDMVVDFELPKQQEVDVFQSYDNQMYALKQINERIERKNKLR